MRPLGAERPRKHITSGFAARYLKKYDLLFHGLDLVELEFHGRLAPEH
jgi:hypothetical protein